MPTPPRRLSPDEITRLSSYYLAEGKQLDRWEITHIDIADRLLTANIRMRSCYASPSDPGGFHLTPFSTLEFLSQLTIIFIHAWAGYTEKTREVWMIESAISCKNAIRDTQNIQVRMRLASAKKVGERILFVTKSKVLDKQGLFEVELKGLLS